MPEETRTPEAPDTIVSQSGVAAVLNGGSNVMESGTVPVQWFFAENIAAMSPTHVLVIEQNDSEANDVRKQDLGRRYLLPVKRGVAFIEFFRPGRHRVMVCVLHPEADEERHSSLLAHEKNGRFKESIEWTEKPGYPFVGTRIMECVVPKEVFAERPETGWSKLVWKWANYLHSDEPVDQCAYRRRKIAAFTWRPFAIAGLFAGKGLVWAAQLVFGFLFAAILLIADVVIIFIGFRPSPIWKNVKEALLLRTNMMSDKFTMGWGYRVWLYKDGKVHLMPVTGAEIVAIPLLLFVIGSSLIQLLLGAGVWILAALVFIAATAFLLTLAFTIMTRIPSLAAYALSRKKDRAARIREREEREKAEEERRKTEERELAHRWLVENYGLDRIPERVNLGLIPRPLKRGDRIVQRFYVSYWRTKIRVCKPFAQ